MKQVMTWDVCKDATVHSTDEKDRIQDLELLTEHVEVKVAKEKTGVAYRK